MGIVRHNFLHNHDCLAQSTQHEHVVVDRSDWEKARRILLMADSEEEARTKLVEQCKNRSYEFCVYLDEGTIVTDEVIESILSSGCEDGTVVTSGSRAWVRFSREAESLEEAIRTAIANVSKAGCIVTHAEVYVDGLI